MTHVGIRTSRWFASLPLCVALAAVALTLCSVSPARAQKAGDVMKVVVPGTDGVEIEMVYIPGGTFLMGSPAKEDGRNEDEGPQITVEVEPFWISKYEVTWEQYKPFSSKYDKLKNAGVKAIPADKQVDAVSFPTPIYPQEAVPIYEAMGWGDRYPVSDMTQLSAKQYTKWLTITTGKFFRLPTEAEWEYAARAGTKSAYYFGDDPADLETHGYHYDNSTWDDPTRGHPKAEGRGYREVGSLKKGQNPWGLYDMSGNVAEWVIDGYDAEHYKKLHDKFGDKTIPWRDAVNWPKGEYPRVVRGGHWDSDAEACRSASRLASSAKWKDKDPQIPKSIWWHTDGFMVGIRLIMPVKAADAAEKAKFWEPDYELAHDVIKNDEKQARSLVEPGKSE